ncbi:Zeta-carotene desaturase, chloroplastic/chromoplastic, partial [Mucuna pruriens]
MENPISPYMTNREACTDTVSSFSTMQMQSLKSADGSIFVTGLSMSKATAKKNVKADGYVAACDVPGIKRLIPLEWREQQFFNNIYELVGVPVVTVQLTYNGWVTELQDLEKSRQLRKAVGLDNLLYTPDADFSCFADLALSSPEDYYIEGQGSLLQKSAVPEPQWPPLQLPQSESSRCSSKQEPPPTSLSEKPISSVAETQPNAGKSTTHVSNPRKFLETKRSKRRTNLKFVDAEIVNGGELVDVDDFSAELPNFTAELLDSLPLESVVPREHMGLFVRNVARCVVVFVACNDIVVFFFIFFYLDVGEGAEGLRLGS